MIIRRRELQTRFHVFQRKIKIKIMCVAEQKITAMTGRVWQSSSLYCGPPGMVGIWRQLSGWVNNDAAGASKLTSLYITVTGPRLVSV